MGKKSKKNSSKESENSNSTYGRKYASYGYIHGYYDSKSNLYGYDGFIKHNNIKYPIKKTGGDSSTAGHILGCMALVEKAIELNIKNIDLFFELEGLKYWSTGEWNRKTEGTKELYAFMQRAKYKININFIKYNKSIGFLDLLEKDDSNNNNEGVDQEKKVE